MSCRGTVEEDINALIREALQSRPDRPHDALRLLQSNRSAIFASQRSKLVDSAALSTYKTADAAAKKLQDLISQAETPMLAPNNPYPYHQISVPLSTAILQMLEMGDVESDTSGLAVEQPTKQGSTTLRLRARLERSDIPEHFPLSTFLVSLLALEDEGDRRAAIADWLIDRNGHDLLRKARPSLDSVSATLNMVCTEIDRLPEASMSDEQKAALRCSAKGAYDEWEARHTERLDHGFNYGYQRFLVANPGQKDIKEDRDARIRRINAGKKPGEPLASRRKTRKSVIEDITANGSSTILPGAPPMLTASNLPGSSYAESSNHAQTPILTGQSAYSQPDQLAHDWPSPALNSLYAPYASPIAGNAMQWTLPPNMGDTWMGGTQDGTLYPLDGALVPSALPLPPTAGHGDDAALLAMQDHSAPAWPGDPAGNLGHPVPQDFYNSPFGPVYPTAPGAQTGLHDLTAYQPMLFTDESQADRTALDFDVQGQPYLPREAFGIIDPSVTVLVHRGGSPGLS